DNSSNQKQRKLMA
ncbi:exonuclease family protein, partial [Vibrio parahaemolyticus V-223/04]